MTEKYPTYEFEIPQINKIYLEVFDEWGIKHCKKLWRITFMSINENDIRLIITFIGKDDALKFKMTWM